MSNWEEQLRKKLDQQQQNGSLRTLKPENLLRVDFTSNDYLGLAHSTELTKLIRQKLDTLPLHLNGATGSRLLSGNFTYTQEVEAKLAQLFQSESTLILNSGYSANMAVLSSIPLRNDTIIYDELAHACIKDGARLSLAKHFSFRHNDLGDLEGKLQRASGRIFIAVESIYSMDGDQCPLQELVALAERYDAAVIVDEAHSTGVLGEHGSGLCTALGLQNRIAIRVYTFGKAMGIHGACVAASKIVTDYLINFARPFIYTTALPPHGIASIDCAFEYVKNNPSLQHTLRDNVTRFISGIRKFPNRTDSASAIQTAIFPGNSAAKEAATTLQKNGFDIRAILSPTVPTGLERLRICLHTYNTKDEIDALTLALNAL